MTILGGKSVVFRLTLLFAAMSTAILLLLGVLIGASVERHFVEQDMEALNGKLELARQMLARLHSRQELATLSQQFANALIGHHGLALLIEPPGGKPLFATDDADFPAALLDHPSAGRGGHPVAWVTPEGRPWRGIASRESTGIADCPVLIVAVATDISHHEHFMASFRATLWSFVGIAALIAGFLGWLVARRGLAPLQAIQREAENVTAQRLHTRIAVENIPVELASIATSLNAMFARLEDSFRRLSDFASDLAHELRTPVSNLLTQTQVTLSKARSPDEYRDILSSNAEELERMARMVADMLFLAKADNGLIVPACEKVDLGAEIRDLFDFYGLLAEEKGIVLTLAGQGSVWGDRLMLRRAVSNLLSNAIRHCSPQGWVKVTIQSDDSAETLLSVGNSGAAIAAEHLPRLFDRFYRADASRHRSSEGAGLGLAITQSIVAAHGGSILVRSGESENTFELRFPAPVCGKRVTVAVPN